MENGAKITQKEKELLLRDLSARLPYGVVCKGVTVDINVVKDEYENREVEGLLTNIGYDYCTLGIMTECELNTIKPYLRPISSMTEEEKKTDEMFFNEDGLLNTSIDTYLDWLLENHFDYRGLIPKGLAIEATEDMYDIK